MIEGTLTIGMHGATELVGLGLTTEIFVHAIIPSKINISTEIAI